MIRYPAGMATSSLPAHELEEEARVHGHFGGLCETLPTALDRRAFCGAPCAPAGGVFLRQRNASVHVCGHGGSGGAVHGGRGLFGQPCRLPQVRLAWARVGVRTLGGDISFCRGARNRDVRGVQSAVGMERFVAASGSCRAELLCGDDVWCGYQGRLLLWEPLLWEPLKRRKASPMKRLLQREHRR